jgi:hypothetical protein
VHEAVYDEFVGGIKDVRLPRPFPT